MTRLPELRHAGLARRGAQQFSAPAEYKQHTSARRETARRMASRRMPTSEQLVTERHKQTRGGSRHIRMASCPCAPGNRAKYEVVLRLHGESRYRVESDSVPTARSISPVVGVAPHGFP